jgi:Holliday junction resolvase RusA-like endonuclease
MIDLRTYGRRVSFVLNDLRVIAKKNSKMLIKNRATGRPLMICSSAYKKFHTDAYYQLLSQRNAAGGKWPLKPPYEINIIFGMKGKITTDKDNMEASIYDVLQDTKIITDDAEVICGREYKIGGYAKFQTMIFIAERQPFRKDEIPVIMSDISFKLNA